MSNPHDSKGDKVATWLFEKALIDLEHASEEPNRLEEADEVAVVDWQRLFPGKRPTRNAATLTKEQARDQRRLSEAPEDWRDAWCDLWEDELEGDVIDAVLGALGTVLSGHSTAEASAGEWGWDVAAWYQQLHFFGYDWGIYIKERAMIRQARYIGSFLSPQLLHQIPRSILAKTLLRASFAAYFLHEHYHHKVECLAIRFFVVENQPRYRPYWQSVYRPALGTDDLLEEALANADAYRRLSTAPYRTWLPASVKEATQQALKMSFARAPKGYRKAIRYLTKGDFDKAENRLQSMVQESLLTPTRLSDEWNFAPHLMHSFFNVTDDLWTVVPRGKKHIVPIKAAPVRVGSSKDTLQLLQQLGYTIVSGGGKGSHIKLKKPGRQPVIVPANRENLSPGTGRNIAKAVGLGGLGLLQIALAGNLPLTQLVKMTENTTADAGC